MTDQFRISRLLVRVVVVLVLQAAGLGVIAVGTRLAVKWLDYDELDALAPYLVLLIGTELALVLGVATAGVRSWQSGRRDVGGGWLLGLGCLVVVPFLTDMLASFGIL
jgi:hypothetical protein